VFTGEVGGHFASFETPGLPIFGAIIALTDSADFPDSVDYSSADVLGVALFTPTFGSSEVSGALNIQLQPGTYALVFGTDLFGATGQATMPLVDADIGTPDYIFLDTSAGMPDVWRNGGFSGARMFVTTGLKPIPVPALGRLRLAILVGSLLATAVGLSRQQRLSRKHA
jgi:hypothetical protein